MSKKKGGGLRILRLSNSIGICHITSVKKSKDTDGLCSPGQRFAKRNWGKESAAASTLSPRRDEEQLSDYAFDLLTLTSSFQWQQNAPQGSTPRGLLPSPLLPAFPSAVGREVGARMWSMPRFRVGSARKGEGHIKMSCTTCIQLKALLLSHKKE